MIAIETTTVTESVRSFIADELLFGDRDGLPADEASLMQGGVIDSTDVLELICFVEDKFGISVADADVVPRNFDSVRGIAEYVTSHRLDQGQP